MSFEDDISSINSTSGYSFQSMPSSMNSDNRTGSTQHAVVKGSRQAGKLENEKFLRSKYLEGRARKLKSRLQDRPYDVRALREYSEVLYEQQNFILAQKVIRRLIAAGDDSGHWHLKLGKCSYRRWMVYLSSQGTLNVSRLCFLF